MIIQNRKTGELENIKDINIKYHGTFSDIISHATAKFMYENSDPKIFFLDMVDREGNELIKKYNIRNTGSLHGHLADIRFTYINQKGYIVKSLRIYYKPKDIQKKEQQFATNGIIQDPVTYTIIFSNQSTETNERKGEEGGSNV